jgi:hypothetical protein
VTTALWAGSFLAFQALGIVVGWRLRSWGWGLFTVWALVTARDVAFADTYRWSWVTQDLVLLVVGAAVYFAVPRLLTALRNAVEDINNLGGRP